MIAKKNRVPREKISYILSKGGSSTSRFFIIRYTGNDVNFSRYRTIVSKKIDAQAVNRNKLRRQIYEATRENIKIEEKNSPKYDIILIPKKSIKETDFKHISEDISSIILNPIQ